MRILMVAAIIVLISGAAFAEPRLTLPMGGDKQGKQVDEEKEKAYKSSLEKVPDKKTSDPWQSIRPNPATQSKKSN